MKIKYLKPFYLFNFILLFLISGCGVSDMKKLVKIDKTAPLLRVETKTIDIRKMDEMPVISFYSSEKGTLLYEKGCESSVKKVHTGKNTIIFDNLPNGYYDFCTITVVDLAGNQSETVNIPPFVINRLEQPFLYEVTPVTENTSDNTPDYVFRSSSEGKISYKGSCRSIYSKAEVGNNVVTFEALADGFYDDCYISVTDEEGRESNLLHVTPFSVARYKTIELSKNIIPERLGTLDQKIDESSGLLYIEGRLFTHNDSSGHAEIYEIDNYGRLLRTIKINGAVNVDWEAMTQDKDYLYIADIGNNRGDRKDLKIYKIVKSDFMHKNSVESEVIEIKYGDQKKFGYKNFSTPYDAEAIISYGEKLYIFTKNWKNRVTKVYAVSKEPGTYKIEEVTAYAFDFVVTGATYIEKTDMIVLIGYSSRFMTKQKIVILDGFKDDDFFSGHVKVIDLKTNLLGFKQIESIANDGAEKVYITSEKVTNRFLGNHPASLFEIKLFR
jgi:hypothetical protein